jgi:hypothetical protein
MQVEGAGDSEYSHHPRTALGALDEADIIAIETGELGQFLLAEPFGIAVAADFVPERQEIPFFILHAGNVASGRKTFYLLPVSDADSHDL